ncbi:restriction endonuclease subunit S, partial [Metamycoplasma hominis]
VEYKKIGDLGILYNGLSGKNKNDFLNNTNKQYITYLNIFNNLSIDIKSLEKVSVLKNEKQNRVLYGDILFTTSSESANECGYASVANDKYFDNNDVYLNSFCFGYRLFNIENYNVNYFKYLFKDLNIRKEIIKCVNGVTRFNLSKEQFKRILIPIPPLEIQN